MLAQIVASASAFHSADSEAYVQVGSEIWAVKSRNTRLWLIGEVFEKLSKAPTRQAIAETLSALEAQALFKGPEDEVSLRLAEKNGIFYFDRADQSRESVAVSADGWSLIRRAPVRFRRDQHMRPAPRPVSGGRIHELGQFINIASADFPLIVAWLVSAIRPRGPFPILILHGCQGSAKSTTAKILRKLIDPNKSLLRAPPRDIRDLSIAAKNGWVCGFDNLSYLADWNSDALCRLATGAGFATRKLFSDGDEIVFEAQRPILLNGIEEFAVRGDLLDRSIIIHAPPIGAGKRRSEDEIFGDFDRAAPRILGALFDAVVYALGHIGTTKIDDLPRMADFALWAVAAEPALGFRPGTILNTYLENQQRRHELALEADTVAAAVRTFAAKHNKWEGTATELLQHLTKVVANDANRTGWPRKPNVLSNRLRRIGPNLQAIGIHIEFSAEGRDSTKRRIIRLWS